VLDVNEIPQLVSRMWLLHERELLRFDTVHDYERGELGKPHLPESADAEVKAIRDLCVHNVLDKVVAAFVQNLAVVGYHNGDASDNAVGWAVWQANQMDARQTEVHTDAVKYGVGYAFCTLQGNTPKFRLRSPRQVVAVYDDPSVDVWPQVALETWIDETDAKPRRKGMFFDDTHMWPLDLGPLSSPLLAAQSEIRNAPFTIHSDGIGDPVPHGGKADGNPVCPVVRYIDRRNSENLVCGEIEPLINDQREINEVNFDRLIVARFGAFPQKVISGWAGTKQEVLEASARKVWAFDDEQVKAWTLNPASLEPYNGLIESLEQHIASRAQISPMYVNTKFVNVGADAVAAGEANQQRKLTLMRDSFGESHEQLLGLALTMMGVAVDDSAEVVWRDTEARNFGIIADGIIKIAQALISGAPVEPLLSLVPGVTQQMIVSMKKQAKTSSVTQLVTGLRQAAQAASGDQQVAQLAGQTGPADTSVSV
jgi:hypothetical protein